MRLSLDCNALDPPNAIDVEIRFGFLVVENYRTVIVLNQSLLGWAKSVAIYLN